MSRTLSSARFAALLAVAVILFGAGVVSGAAGQPLIIGSANNAGVSNTSLDTTSGGFAWQMYQHGSGVGVFAISDSGVALAALANNGNQYGLSVTNNGTAGSGSAIIADGRNNVAIRASSDAADGMIVESGTCSGLFCGRDGIEGYGYGFGSGVYGEGGLSGVSGTAFFGVMGVDNTGDGTGYGLYTDDDANVGGDLTVGGTCTGCTAAALGVNASGAPIAAGTAVTAVGATTDADGRLLLQVRPAAAGEAIVGVVDSALAATQVDQSADASTLSYKPSGSTAADGAFVRVVTSGLVALAAEASGGITAAGADLSVSSATPGALSQAAEGSAASVATVVGSLPDGRVVVLVGAD